MTAAALLLLAALAAAGLWLAGGTVLGPCCCGGSGSSGSLPPPACMRIRKPELHATVTGPNCAFCVRPMTRDPVGSVSFLLLGRNTEDECAWAGAGGSGNPDECPCADQPFDGGRGFGLWLAYHPEDGTFEARPRDWPARSYCGPPRITGIVPLSYEPIHLIVSWETDGVGDCCHCPEGGPACGGDSASGSGSGSCGAQGPYTVTLEITE